MKQPNSCCAIAWAKYNEWLSGARFSVTPAEDYADVKEESTGTRDSRVPVYEQHPFD